MSGLAGKGILVTRPRDQAQGLIESLSAAGARPILFPAIEITAPGDTSRLYALIDRLREFDLAIFISPTAVAQAMPHIRERLAVWPAALRVVAVGPGGAGALNQAGIHEVLVSQDGADSEALLSLPELAHPMDKRVIIFRGEGGRELLAETLRARGARVEYAECYRRQCPIADVSPILEEWQQGKLDAIVATSSEGIRNLFALFGEAGNVLLRSTPMFVPHARIAAVAHALGVHRVQVAGPGDAGLLISLKDWFAYEQPSA